MNRAFQSEAELLESVQRSHILQGLHCQQGWQIWSDCEVDGLFGRPDYLIGYHRVDCCGRQQIRTVAFEMKLHDWKRALTQAFRYAAFSHYAYVLMDDRFVGRALRFIDRFYKANIGLLSYSTSGDFFVHNRPLIRSPYAPVVYSKLQQKILYEIQSS